MTLKFVFAEGQVPILHIKSQYTSLGEHLTRTEIEQISNDGKLHFTHRRFAEVYVADYFVKGLTESPIFPNKYRIPPTESIYVFCVDLRTNSDYFPVQY
jgi:hypothetical protein